MSENVTWFENVTCSKCGGHLFDSDGIQDGIYVCKTESQEKGKFCNNTMYLCKKCNKVYPKSNYGKRGDVYECKECGAIQWAYTESERNYEAFMKQAASLNNLLNSF